MKTLILPARYTPDSIALSGAAVEAGWQVERLQTWRPPPYLRDADTAIYGEPLFGAVVASELSLLLLEPRLGWLAELSSEYLLRQVRFTTLAGAKQCTGRAFIKPADDKSFPAAVYEDASGIPVGELLPDTLPVLISEPVVWDVEFRFFVCERRVATFSAALRRGALIEGEDGSWRATDIETAEATEFCTRIVADSAVPLPPSVALDVGHIDGSGWAVVEANAAWASGIYGCDPGKVLDVVARACVRGEEASAEDMLWVVQRGASEERRA